MSELGRGRHEADNGGGDDRQAQHEEGSPLMIHFEHNDDLGCDQKSDDVLAEMTQEHAVKALPRFEALLISRCRGAQDAQHDDDEDRAKPSRVAGARQAAVVGAEEIRGAAGRACGKEEDGGGR